MGPNLDLSPLLIEQLVVRKGVTIAGIVQKMGIVEMGDDGIDIFRRARPCVEFGTHLFGAMLGTGAIRFSTRAKFVRFQRVFSGGKVILLGIYGGGSFHVAGRLGRDEVK